MHGKYNLGRRLGALFLAFALLVSSTGLPRSVWAQEQGGEKEQLAPKKEEKASKSRAPQPKKDRSKTSEIASSEETSLSQESEKKTASSSTTSEKESKEEKPAEEAEKTLETLDLTLKKRQIQEGDPTKDSLAQYPAAIAALTPIQDLFESLPQQEGDQVTFRKITDAHYQNDLREGKTPKDIDGDSALGTDSLRRVGKYRVQVRLKRSGKEIKSPWYLIYCLPQFDTKDRIYNGKQQEFIKVKAKGRLNGYQLQYRVDKDHWVSDVPKATNPGTYKVYVRFIKEKYKDQNFGFYLYQGRIIPAEIKGYRKLKASEEQTYTGKPYPVLKEAIESRQEGDKIQYKAVAQGQDPNQVEWEDRVPVRREAGVYTVYARVIREFHESLSLEPVTFTIQPADQTIAFDEESWNHPCIQQYELNGTFLSKITASSKNNPLAPVKITVKDVLAKEEGEVSYFPRFIFDEKDNTLIVFRPCVLEVTATVEGSGSFKRAELHKRLNFFDNYEKESPLIWGSSLHANYLLGTNRGTINEFRVKNTDFGNTGKIHYELDEEAKKNGYDLDENGRLTVKNLPKAVMSLHEKGGEEKITVTAILDEVTAKKDGQTYLLYGASRKSYDTTVRFADTPNFEKIFEIIGRSNRHGIYRDQIKISSVLEKAKLGETPKALYNFCKGKNFNEKAFKEEIVFNNELENRSFWAREVKTGAILDLIELKHGLDTQPAEFDSPWAVKFVEDTPGDKLNEFRQTVLAGKETWYIYNPEATVLFRAADRVSGVESIRYTYYSEEGKTLEKGTAWVRELSKAEREKVLLENFTDKEEEARKAYLKRYPHLYEASVKLNRKGKAATKGYFKLVATDGAGHATTYYSKQTNRSLIIDNTVPTGKDNQENKTEPFYSNRPIDYEVEARDEFLTEDNPALHYSVVMDGNTMDPAPSMAIRSITEQNRTVGRRGTLHLDRDGSYVVHTNFTDLAGNKMKELISRPLVVDTTKPAISAQWVKGDRPGLRVIVDEKNFDPQKITSKESLTNIWGDSLPYDSLQDMKERKNWTQLGDHFVYEKKLEKDGRYDLSFHITDLAGNFSDFSMDSYLLDRQAPSQPLIQLPEEPLELMELGGLAYRFYNKPITIRVFSRDDGSGVKSFHFSYRDQDGNAYSKELPSQEVNLEGLKQSAANVQERGFYSELTVPMKDWSEMRGSFQVFAVDGSGNRSEVTRDQQVVVVDTIQPRLKVVDLGKVQGQRKGVNYYKGSTSFRLELEEENFFKNHDRVEVVPVINGVAQKPVELDWQEVPSQKYRYVSNLTFTNDGSYSFRIQYKDHSKNPLTFPGKKEGQVGYEHPAFVIDSTPPELTVSYTGGQVRGTGKDAQGNPRDYLSEDRIAHLVVKERNFNPEDYKISLTATDLGGSDVGSSSIQQGEWSNRGDIHEKTIRFRGDANYRLSMEGTDPAGNRAKTFSPAFFTVDKTPPEQLHVQFPQAVLQKQLPAGLYRFYRQAPLVVISAYDPTSPIKQFIYNYRSISGLSAIHGQGLHRTVEEGRISYGQGGRLATLTFPIPEGGLGAGSQFNGFVDFQAVNRSGMQTQYRDPNFLVVDNIAPKAGFRLPNPVTKKNGVSYYAAPVQVTLPLEEANFFSQDFRLSATKDGQALGVSPTWSQAGDTHTGSLTLSGDGRYVLSASYTDPSGNAMAPLQAEPFIIDTEIKEPVVTMNQGEGNGKAFAKEAKGLIRLEDKNFGGYTLSIHRSRWGKKDEDVTKLLLDHTELGDQGGLIYLKNLPEEAENDGIYHLTVGMDDLAGHHSQKEVTWTLNRFGSVYEYGSSLLRLISPEPAFVKTVPEDLVIREYNPTPLVAHSLLVDITRDGKPLEKPEVDVKPLNNEKVKPGESGWYEYEYRIKAKNLKEDGQYKITVSSQDQAGNTPQNDATGDPILFYVDTKKPEITSVTGLEDAIIDGESQTVNYELFDAMGLQSFQVFVNDKPLGGEIKNFGQDSHNFKGSFQLKESDQEQHIRLLVKDKAGNVTDTAKKDFKAAYPMNASIILSKNWLVRWFSNKPLFFGSLGLIFLFLLLVFFLLFRRKKEEEEEAPLE